MTRREACALLQIGSNEFFELMRGGRIRVLKRAALGAGHDFCADDVHALIDDEEVIALRERALRYGDEEYQPPVVRPKRATIITESVSEAYARFIKAVTDACFSSRLTRDEAEARMEHLLSSLWDSTEVITEKLPNPAPGSRASSGAGPGKMKKTRAREAQEALCA